MSTAKTHTQHTPDQNIKESEMYIYTNTHSVQTSEMGGDHFFRVLEKGHVNIYNSNLALGDFPFECSFTKLLGCSVYYVLHL